MYDNSQEGREPLDRLIVRVPRQMLVEIDQAATDDRTVTRSAVIRAALNDYLARRRPRPSSLPEGAG